MSSRIVSRRSLVAAIAAVVAASGIGVEKTFAGSPVYIDDSGKASAYTVVGPYGTQSAPARYIVRFVEKPLALYNSVVSSQPVNGISAIPSKTMSSGRVRLDVHSAQALSYVQYLKQQQQQHLSAISAALGKTITPKYSMQHALNAVLVELTPDQVNRVQQTSGVVAVTRDVPHSLDTDIGPGFIGAASVWWGTPAGQDTLFASGFDNAGGFRGDGIVIGDIDTGYNSLSPSFQPTDDNGYTVQNPLGAGNYIGQCGVPGISLGGCNDKVIGVYDEIDLTNSCSTLPCPAFSVEDTQGHGSHTASTAAGNHRAASFSGYDTTISGVAPHANLVIYYACSPDPAVQCSESATSASVDQAIQDGVVDALNYSISGGRDPWNDPTSLAFLAAADAGIFVAAAAGNTSASTPVPLPGTSHHWEPWVTSVAASTHTGGSIAPTLTVTGPGSPPANVQNVPLTAGANGVSATAAFSGPIVLSPQFHNSDLAGTDGCTGYPAGTFTGAVALVSRGTCSFTIKVNAATAAGALAVVISDNRVEGPLSPSVPGTTIPAYAVLQSQGTDLQTFLAANSGAGTAVISYPPSRLPQQPDVLAGFSLLGPTTFDVMKPDVQAPGVNILAAVANDGDPNAVDLYNGTSMATPHTTGSGALMMAAHPTWSGEEIKSALMMTAKEDGLTKPDGVTPSDFFDRGSGRIQDFPASKAGLVLNETGLNFTAANPALGGDTSALNVPSMQSNNCVTVSGVTSTSTCTFIRLFRTTQNHTVTWTAAFTGVSATATPSSLSIHAGANPQPIAVTVDATGYASDDSFHFGEMTLTADDTSLPVLHLPIAVKILPPAIAVAPSSLSLSIPPPKTTRDGTLTVTNTGGPTLNVTNTNDNTTPSTKFVVIDQPSQGNNGYYATFFTDFGTGSYASDDFVAPGNGTNLSAIVVPGFSTGTSLSSLAGTGVHFQIYADAGGLPDGGPEGLGNAPVYSYDTTIGSTGLSVAGNTISLDLVAAGATATNLPAGTYWLVVFVDMAYATDGGFAQFVTTAGQGNIGAEFGPVFAETNWAAITDAPGFAMHIEEQVPCGAAWLSTTPPTLTLGGLLSGTVTVTADSTQFPTPGHGMTADAFLCIDSNDANNPVVPVLVHALQQ